MQPEIEQRYKRAMRVGTTTVEGEQAQAHGDEMSVAGSTLSID